MWHSHWKLFTALCNTSVLHTIAALSLQHSSLLELHFCSSWLSLQLSLGASLHTLHSTHSTLWCCSLHSFYREIAMTISLSLSLFRILRLRETAFLNINFNKCQPKVHTQFQHLISTISGQRYPNLQVAKTFGDLWVIIPCDSSHLACQSPLCH